MAQRQQSHAINIRGVQESWPLRFPKGKSVPLPVLSPSPIFSRLVSQQALFVAVKRPHLWKELVPGGDARRG